MSKDFEIDIMDLLGYIRKKWMVVVIVPLVAMILSFGLFKFVMSPVYESSSMIYITSGGNNVVSNMLSELQAGTALTADYKTLATSKPVLEQVIEELKLDTTYEELAEEISTDNPENTRILTITVKNKNPQDAKTIVNTLTEIVIDKIADVMETSKPNILQWGDIEVEPVAPNAIPDALNVGFAILVLVLGALVVSFLQNDTISTAEDIEKALGLRNLAQVPVLAEKGDK